MTKRQPLGALLITEGVITQEQLEAALSAQRQFRGRLGTNLVELRCLNVDQVAAGLSRQHGVPAALRADFLTMDVTLARQLPARAAKMYGAIPLGPSTTKPRTIRVAVLDPDNIVALDEIATILACRIEPVVAPELRMLRALERLYGIKPARRTFLRVVLDRPLLQRSKQANPAARERSLTPPSLMAVAPEPPRAPPPSPRAASPAPRSSTAASPAPRSSTAASPAPRSSTAASPAPRSSTAASPAPPELGPSDLADLAEDDALALLEPLPEAREPSPAPPAPSDPSALRPYGLPLRTARHSAPPSQVGTRFERQVPGASSQREDAATTTSLSGAEAADPPAGHQRPPHGEPLRYTRASAMTPEEALACALRELDRAPDRDAVGNAAVRYLERAFAGGLVLIIKGDLALGWLGAGLDVDATRLESLLIPLSAPSLFRAVLETGRAFRGAPPMGGEVIHQRFWRSLGLPAPREVLAAPVVLKSRVVNLVYTQGSTNALPVMAEADVVRLSVAMAGAYQRLIRAKHR